MQVFFAWVAAQKLSSCKQRIITSCTSGLHNKLYGSTHYDARSASRGNLIAILIVFILRKSWYFTIFLFFTPKYAIIINNAVKCWNGLWQYGGNCLDAPPGGRAFFISVRRRYFISVRYKKLRKMLIDKNMKKKGLCEKAGISPASVTKMGRNGHVTTEILVKICTALDCRIEDIIEII